MRWGGLLVVLLCGCSNAPQEKPDPAPQSLKEIPNVQLRMTLKGYSGDWRQDTAHARGEPAPATTRTAPDGANVIALPAVKPESLSRTLGTVLHERRSQRAFTDEAMSLQDLSVVLWAGQGVTQPEGGLRAAPSGGGRFPLNTWIVVRQVEGLAPGIYGYLPESHAVWQVRLLDSNSLFRVWGSLDSIS